eukprot:1767785-Rhodomonas_salina.1
MGHSIGGIRGCRVQYLHFSNCSRAYLAPCPASFTCPPFTLDLQCQLKRSGSQRKPTRKSTETHRKSTEPLRKSTAHHEKVDSTPKVNRNPPNVESPQCECRRRTQSNPARSTAFLVQTVRESGAMALIRPPSLPGACSHSQRRATPCSPPDVNRSWSKVNRSWLNVNT